MDRPKCNKDGCDNVAVRYSRKGKIYYRQFCGRHLELHWGIRTKKELQRRAYHHGLSTNEYSEINMTGCSLCGWNKCICDVHRIINGKDGGKYKRQNIVILCPNCHRLVHRKIISL